jgi:hypothetical protein
VAINVSELDIDRTKYCDKKVIVLVNSVVSDLPLFIGDGCRCCDTGIPSLDFSYSVANMLDSSICDHGYLDLSWEVVDETVQSFDVTSYAENMDNTAPEVLPAASCPTGEWWCSSNAAMLEQCIDSGWSPRETCLAGYSCKGGPSPYCIIV